MNKTNTYISLVALGVLLSACTTTSFAPPSVRVGHVLSREGADACEFSKIADDNAGKKRKINRTATGALKLINNFVLTYRCAAHRAADGRQIFEVPAFLAAVGGVTAAALGTGRDVAIGTGAAAALLNGGKSYYAPKDKAHILNSALDALLCIKTESVGITAFNTGKVDGDNGTDEAVGADKAGVASEDNDSVSFPAERRYFEMVGAALFSVERILSERLSSIGKFDPAGVVAEINSLVKETSDAESEESAGQVGADGATTPNTGAALAEAALASAKATNSASVPELTARVNYNTSLKLTALQPKLQLCVVRAKL